MNILEYFTQHGYLPPQRICSNELALEYQNEFNNMEAELGISTMKQAHKITSKMIFNSKFSRRFIWEIASNNKLLDIISTLIGSNIILLNNTSFFIKYEDEKKHYIAWHQDLTYMQLEPDIMVTAWYAIDDVSLENGCLEIIDGSHKNGLLPHRMTNDKNNMLNNKQEAIFSDELKKLAKPQELCKGEVSIFSGWALHASRANISGKRRAAIAMRFVPTNTKCNHPMIAGGILMRGEDSYHNHKLESEPSFDNSREDLYNVRQQL